MQTQVNFHTEIWPVRTIEVETCVYLTPFICVYSEQDLTYVSSQKNDHLYKWAYIQNRKTHRLRDELMIPEGEEGWGKEIESWGWTCTPCYIWNG